MGDDLVSNAFAHPRQTIGWAKEGIYELDVQCISFFNSKPLKSVIDKDAEAGQQTYKIVLVKTLPSSVARKATETLGHIKNSFDQATHAALSVIRPGKNKVNFPWADSKEDLEYRLGAVTKKSTPSVPKIPPELWSAFRSLEPYACDKGYTRDDNVIRELAEIANRKHTLNLTFVPSIIGGVLPGFRSGPAGTNKGPAPRLLIPRWNSVKNEVILAQMPMGFELIHGVHLALYAAFNEPRPLNELGVVDGLKLFVEKADSVIEVLEKEVRKVAAGGFGASALNRDGSAR